MNRLSAEHFYRRRRYTAVLSEFRWSSHWPRVLNLLLGKINNCAFLVIAASVQSSCT